MYNIVFMYHRGSCAAKPKQEGRFLETKRVSLRLVNSPVLQNSQYFDYICRQGLIIKMITTMMLLIIKMLVILLLLIMIDDDDDDFFKRYVNR